MLQLIEKKKKSDIAICPYCGQIGFETKSITVDMQKSNGCTVVVKRLRKACNHCGLEQTEVTVDHR